MTTPSTQKAVYLNGVQLGFDAALTVPTGSYDPAASVTLIAMDWGTPERERFYRSRPLRDGSRRRGARSGRRTVTLQLLVTIDDAVPDYDVEAVRQDVWDYVLGLLSNTVAYGALSTLKVTGQSDALGPAATSRIIRCDNVDTPAWIWAPDSVAPGYVGIHVGRQAVIPISLECPFPWFENETASATSALTLDGTLRTTAPYVWGLMPCGLQITIAGTGTGLTIVMLNATTGASTVVGSGITLTNVAPTSGNIVIDWYYTDPTAWSVLQGATDLRAKLNTTANHGLLPSINNTLSHQVTVGSPTGCTITYRWKPLWGNP
ncbi:MAG: hypothetical protein ABI780_09720 [Ardenticatenales bacterium]